MSKISSLLRRTFGIVKEHVGTDHFGNKYYSIPEQRTWMGRTVRARRMVEPSKLVESEYTEGSIPSEWDVFPSYWEAVFEDADFSIHIACVLPRAWIRGRRKDPPTIEELERNQLYREQIKQKAREVEERDSTLQAQEYAEGLVARPMQTLIEGHASAKHFRQIKPSEDPISTGSTFEPGSWAPNKGTTSKK